MIPIVVTTCGRSDYFHATLASLSGTTPAQVPICVFDDAVEKLGRAGALAETWRRLFCDPSIAAAIFVEDDVLFTPGWYDALIRWAGHPNLGVLAGFELGRSGPRGDLGFPGAVTERAASTPQADVANGIIARRHVPSVCTLTHRRVFEEFLRLGLHEKDFRGRDHLQNELLDRSGLGRYATCPHVAQHVGVVSTWQHWHNHRREPCYFAARHYSRDLLHLVPGARDEGRGASEAQATHGL